MRSGIEGRSFDDGDKNEDGRALRVHAGRIVPELMYRSQLAHTSSPASRVQMAVSWNAASGVEAKGAGKEEEKTVDGGEHVRVLE